MKLFLSLRELSLMYWSFDGVVALGLPDGTLDTTVPFIWSVLEFHALTN